MARPNSSTAPSLGQSYDLTAGLIERLVCPEGKPQAFLRDAKVPGLRVRVTRAGAKSFVFEGKFDRTNVRRTLGDVRTWTIEQARVEARRLAVMRDVGSDPREVDAQQALQRAEREKQQAAQALTVGELWPTYLEEGRPKRRDAWKPRYLSDLRAMATRGGEPKKRGKGLTKPGPLHPLLGMRLVDITEDSLKAWFDVQAKAGKHQATRALMMFRGFLRWCSVRPGARDLIDRDAGKAPAIMESLPSVKKRTDALEAAQVRGWWEGVTQLPNVTASAYLRSLLLTGARREELAVLQWTEVDFQWSKLQLDDKVDLKRVIPLTRYLAAMLRAMPREGRYVFPGEGECGHIVDVRASHRRALQYAGIDRLTFHGLRRSFSLLGEAAGAPAGAIAQVMGHKPSATAEGYRPRSVDALRPFLQQIEDHILELAGARISDVEVGAKLRAVS